MKYLSFAALVSAAVSASAAQAGELPDPPDDRAGAEAIVVSAARLAVPLDRLASAATVLDKQAIDRSQDIGVTELLLRTPGITMSRNGGYGASTSLRIRGAEAEHTVVVFDGVKLNDPSSTRGGYDFANLLVGDAARIEVLRGPQSILWGSQAIGGVVNIVTALPEKSLEASFDIESGSRQTVSTRAAIGGKAGPLAWRVGGQAFTTDGISALSPEFGGVERDGNSNRSLSARALLDVAPGLSFEVRGYYSLARTDIDATTADTPEYTRNEEWVGYAGVNLELMDGRFRNRFAYARTETDRDNYNPARARPQTFDAAGSNRRLEYQGSFAIAPGWVLLAGAEDERSSFRSLSPPASLAVPIPAAARGDARITSFYTQLNAEPVSGVSLTAGLRHDDHGRFGGRTLLAAGGVWRLPTGTILRASYGEGFKAPSLFQLFSEFGNVALDPEQARGWEAGVEQRLFGGAMALGANYFERTTRNQIIYNGCTPASVDLLCRVPGDAEARRAGFYSNVARAEAHGVEAQLSLALGALRLDGNYSRILAEDRSTGSASFGNWLPRRPREQANASITYDWPAGLTTGAALRWSGRSYDNAANTTVLEAYAIVDLRAEYRLNESVRLFARVENLFDAHYMTIFRYGTLGRSLFAGIRGRL